MDSSSSAIEQSGRSDVSVGSALWARLADDVRALVLVSFVAVIVMGPLMIWGIPQGADLANHYRFAMPFFESLQKGNFHPGWLAESNGGYGDPRFRFYPPALYFLLAAAHSVAGWYWASVFCLVFLSVIGSVGVYFWGRNYLTPRGAMWAAICYAIVPYRLNELYQASLLSEYFACAVLPFVLAFVGRLCRRGRAVDVAGLGLSYALLILANLPMAVIGSISALIFACLQLKQNRLLLSLAKLSMGVLLALGASAFFWVGMVAELPWIKGHDVNSNVYYDYRANFLFSSLALTNRNTWYANLLALVLLGFLSPVVILLARKMQRDVKAITGLLVFSFLMATPLSRPLWAAIPKLSQIQFPWRWLAITSLAGSLLMGFCIGKWVELLKTRIRPVNLVPLLGFALSLFFIATQIVWDTEYLNRQKFDGLLPQLRRAASFKDWLPVNARNFVDLPKMNSNVEVGSRMVEVLAWEPEFRRFRISSGFPESAQIRTYHYPSWTATVDSQAVPVSADSNGVCVITVPQSETTVEMKFGEARFFSATKIISALSVLLLAIMPLGQLALAAVAKRGPSILGKEAEVLAQTRRLS